MENGTVNTLAAAPDADDIDAQMRRLMEAIYRKYSYDFRDYTGASQKRRVAHALAQLNCPTIPALQAGVERDPTLFQQLLQYLTIPVSEMFRDPAFFLTLREQVLPVLQTYPSLKIWVAGCSTGEEAYSLAILLKEEGLLERSLIYATDINATSLDKARRGIFPLASVRTHTTNYQQAGGRRAFSDYYIAAYDGAIFDKTLAQNITFADHSLATDSVFSETQLVLCRNVLIYFNRTLQDRALGLFHESLSHRGFLGLGSKESIDFSAYANRFEPLVKAQRLFRKH
ncbi:MAG: chemotaxis protein CheR [Polaromonas sp. 39-63-203]|jgi:chemotaxis protein methyltransferase CheR|uniref:CheR family methyltransferase n=1 Tax=Polaromonas sp. TaxID=1869339 RepID=UPI000BD7724F|nr:protein-glutamate O-methyltransferase CheR [Polaromonas sp.]OYZ83649.1 MAG: chemotaxis protein CheR [Polaromonas sp. 24-62-144]OZA97601.1 MAG: chemotaxis protein CheR [Polaromonas sp. 39-63-203]HQS32285.1 protein-glutamate O-methyltransferase CheR [Polaromonas sp.]HQS91403.1 protein-glutamate O-methyltransferase CheR [Polaromonas sp.]